VDPVKKSAPFPKVGRKEGGGGGIYAGEEGRGREKSDTLQNKPSCGTGRESGEYLLKKKEDSEGRGVVRNGINSREKPDEEKDSEGGGERKQQQLKEKESPVQRLSWGERKSEGRN